MGEGSGLGEGLCWVECQGFQASLNNDAKREYLINQSGFSRLSVGGGDIADKGHNFISTVQGTAVWSNLP